jgi:hypothetical protein
MVAAEPTPSDTTMPGSFPPSASTSAEPKGIGPLLVIT